MEQQARWRQLDLLVVDKSAIQRQRLAPLTRLEITKLLELLLDECVIGAVSAKEPAHE